GDAGAAGYEGESGVGSGLAKCVRGREPLQLLLQRWEAGIGIDAKFEGKLATSHGAAGDRSKHAVLTRIGSMHGRLGGPENMADTAEGITDGLARRGDQVFGGAERLKRCPSRRFDRGLGTPDLRELRSRGHLSEPDAQEVASLDRKRSPIGRHAECVLEVFEADMTRYCVAGAVRQIGRQDLSGGERRRLLVLGRQWRLRAPRSDKEDGGGGERRGPRVLRKTPKRPLLPAPRHCE